MKLSLRSLLAICFLLGAVAIPWGWKLWDRQRLADAEQDRQLQIDRLETQVRRLTDQQVAITMNEDFKKRQAGRKPKADYTAANALDFPFGNAATLEIGGSHPPSMGNVSCE